MSLLERAHSTKRQSPARQFAVRTMLLVPSKTVAACAGHAPNQNFRWDAD
jgi:hypothetical protein